MQNNTWTTAAVASNRRPHKPKPMDRPKRRRKQVVLSVQQLLTMRPNED